MSGDDPFLYVDDGLHILTGEDAARALREHSDAAYLDANEGVVRVPRPRWQEAQRYERDTWMVANAEASDDRNAAHRDGFAGYAVLTGRRFAHAIELGCGPFTNLRIVAQHCDIERCSLLDPLINDYLSHAHCTYDGRTLRVGDTPFGAVLGRTAAGRAVRRLLRVLARGAVERTIPVAELLPIPIEEMKPSGAYDLLIMINVLEHCFDAKQILDNVARSLAPGGVFIFHDKLFSAAEAEADVRTRFDAGHPLRVSSRVIEPFLAQKFTPLYERRSVVADGFEEHDLSRDGIYFIGARK
jgi:SAM-dependent methyltransferase